MLNAFVKKKELMGTIMKNPVRSVLPPPHPIPQCKPVTTGTHALDFSTTSSGVKVSISLLQNEVEKIKRGLILEFCHR